MSHNDVAHLVFTLSDKLLISVQYRTVMQLFRPVTHGLFFSPEPEFFQGTPLFQEVKKLLPALPKIKRN